MFDFIQLFGLWTSNRPKQTGLEGLLSRVSEEVRELVRHGRRPHAIRLFRQQTGASLHQALRVINHLGQEHA